MSLLLEGVDQLRTKVDKSCIYSPHWPSYISYDICWEIWDIKNQVSRLKFQVSHNEFQGSSFKILKKFFESLKWGLYENKFIILTVYCKY